jgi:prepilin-type N-terminal cleavage/methylation domain-containing protein
MLGEGATLPPLFSKFRGSAISQAANEMRKDTSKSSRAKRGDRGFSLIELLIVVAIILIIAAIAIPSLIRARAAANQSSAVSGVRTITSAAVVYSSTYGNNYPPSLATMGGVPGAPPTCNAANLLDEVLTIPPYQKSGYRYDYQPQGAANLSPPPGCAPGYPGYLATATPLVVGQTGQTSYCSNEPGVIRFDVTGVKAASQAACNALPVLQSQ